MPPQSPPSQPGAPPPGTQALALPQAAQRAFAAYQAGNVAEAQRWCDAIRAVNPDNFDALHLSGVIAARERRLDDARRLLARALEINPRSAEAQSNHANILKELGLLEEALASYDKALAISPALAAALNNRGVTLKDLGRYGDALASYDKALANRPAFPEALNNRGFALKQLGRLDEALASYDRALSIRPDFVDALNNRGVALLELGRYDEALTSFERTLTAKPDHIEAQFGRAFLLHRLRRHEEALAAYDAVLARSPDHIGALSHRAAVLLDLGDLDGALANCEQALALNALHVGALCNRGATLQKLRRHEEALASFERALAIRPESLEALNNRGIALRSLERHEDALRTFDRALALKPDYVEALANRGAVLVYLERHAQAVNDFERVLALEPGRAFMAGMLLHTKMHCCDWRTYGPDTAQLISDVRAGKTSAAPFVFLAVSDCAADQLACARTWVGAQCPPAHSALWNGERYRHDRLRLAYLSADFHDHPVAYLATGLFERHDRQRYETIGVSFGPSSRGAMRSRIEAAFDRFIDVRGRSDRDVAELLRTLEVDVLVDLNGFTLDARTAILALRPAPCQVNYLGYPATMGAPYMDFILADGHVIPEELRSQYSEKVVYLPDTFQPNDPRRRIADRAPSRADVALPQHGFVFCSFNSGYKITPHMFDVWMRLLGRVEGSVLWLIAANDAFAENLRREAAARGIESGRLVFAPKLPYVDHLARYRLADLFLDTLPFNAGTTASDALWAGLPILTCPGQAFAARMAASLLHAIGLPEMIADSPQDYERRAVGLAGNSALLADIRGKLTRNRESFPLFDADRFARGIEAAFVHMHSTIVDRGDAPIVTPDVR